MRSPYPWLLLIIRILNASNVPCGLFFHCKLDKPICHLRDVWSIFFFFKEIPVVNANSVNPDQTTHSAASALGLHCLPRSRSCDTKHLCMTPTFCFCMVISISCKSPTVTICDFNILSSNVNQSWSSATGLSKSDHAGLLVGWVATCAIFTATKKPWSYIYIYEPRHDKMCLREFPTRSDSNWPSQPQKLARVLKFRL